VDKLAARDELDSGAIPEILAFLDFKLSSTDAEFLDRYTLWRMANPIAK